MRWFLCCLSVLSCQAQRELPPEILTLGRIKTKMAQNLGSLPNYTCGETIERSVKMPRERKPKLIDTVRLEVALVDGRELFGWPGSNRIAESELSTLVGGTIGNGDFGLHASSVFLSSSSVFTHRGVAQLDGQPAERYEYRVSALNSGYRLRTGNNEALVGYHGDFWVNPLTLDLMRLSLVADEIPEILGLSLVTNQLDYQRIRIGNGEFLLPLGGDLTLTDYSGTEHRNRTRFENCRQYSGESVLSFAEPSEEAPAPTAAEIVAVDLPEDFRVDLSLLTIIDSNRTAVGDPVKLRVEQNVKAGRAVVIPKGALVAGRISQLQRRDRFFTLEIALQTLDFPGNHAELGARFNHLAMVATTPARGNQGRGRLPGPLGPEAEKSDRPLVMETDRLRLYRGFLFHWHSRLLKSEKQ